MTRPSRLTPEELTGGWDEDAPTSERLQRVLAARGVASRRASEDMIAAGRVAVNGTVVTTLGTKVDPLHDEIRVDGKLLRRQRPRYLVLNKPTGFITTLNDERQRWTVMDLIKVQERVYPVGRLDRDTQGLLLLTNDGELANRVMHPRYGMTKEYHVITDVRPSDLQLQDIRDGLLINGRLVVPNECRLMRETAEGVVIRVVLHEGLYHVVRRMMEIVDINVLKLRRVRLGPLSLQGIPPGAWRDLTAGELLQLYEAVGLPLADAIKANETRTMNTTPVGGFTHGARTAGGSAPEPEAESPSAPAPERTSRRFAREQRGGRDRDQQRTETPAEGGGEQREKEAWKRAGQGERVRRPSRSGSFDRSGGNQGGSRSPMGRRNRRSGGRG